MDAEQTNAEIEWLESIFAIRDARPLSPSDLSALNRRHDEKQANSPWFRLWQRYGVCCRTDPTGRGGLILLRTDVTNGEEETCWSPAETHRD
jgi:hypothetical protein